jgi:hypothetical protein
MHPHSSLYAFPHSPPIPKKISYINTANMIPRPATVTSPPPFDRSDPTAALVVDLAVPDDDVLEGVEEFIFLPVVEAVDDPCLPPAPVGLVELAELIRAPPVPATWPAESVAVFAFFLVKV